MWTCRKTILGLILFSGSLFRASAQTQESKSPVSNDYPLTSDSLPKAGVPAGQIFRFSWNASKIFPQTTRTITVYVPAAYRPDRPACVYVALDRLIPSAATVFDNLIAQHEMPVTIGIGVSPGTVPSAKPGENPRYDRSFEFDSLNDRLARFLLEEVLPEVQRHSAPDGRAIVLSTNPDDRAIGGGSTGGIGAFTVAWERPDAFRRVFTAIGTFVGMRGGEQYYVLVRKTEPKPIRIFMQDGVHDEWPGGPEIGDWWMSNQTMERALDFAGYDVRHVWGTGTHNGNQAQAIFPDVLRWLWRDWPAPIQAAAPGNPVLKSILEPGGGWRPVMDGCSPGADLASNPQGKVFYAQAGSRNVVPLTAAASASQCPQTGTRALAFGPDGGAFLADNRGKGTIVAVGSGGKTRILAQGFHVGGMTVRGNGDLYLSAQDAAGIGGIWLMRKNGEKRRLAVGLKGPAGLALSPDGLWLFAAQSRSRSAYSYRVLPDGGVDAPEPFYSFEAPPMADDPGAGSVWMDRDGRAYVATILGVQIFDRNGRATAILPLPMNAPATGLCFGGEDFRTLYVAGGGKVYARTLRVAGAPPWMPPIDLPKGGGG